MKMTENRREVRISAFIAHSGINLITSKFSSESREEIDDWVAAELETYMSYLQDKSVIRSEMVNPNLFRITTKDSDITVRYTTYVNLEI